ncbi:MAG: DUF3606 domain-containing protein [Variovorax sp.]|nr:MAG: DUF3606 domain-containing protein [Variovorax sp.]
MADDKTKVGGEDRKRINLHDDDEVREWAKSLGVTEDELCRAVVLVGNKAAAVQDYLAKK